MKIGLWVVQLHLEVVTIRVARNPLCMFPCSVGMFSEIRTK